MLNPYSAGFLSLTFNWGKKEGEANDQIKQNILES